MLISILEVFCVLFELVKLGAMHMSLLECINTVVTCKLKLRFQGMGPSARK
jgi:hypothetical protein